MCLVQEECNHKGMVRPSHFNPIFVINRTLFTCLELTEQREWSSGLSLPIGPNTLQKAKIHSTKHSASAPT